MTKTSIIDIKNQNEYHKHETFYKEFKRLLIENQIGLDEKYLTFRGWRTLPACMTTTKQPSPVLICANFYLSLIFYHPD